MWIDFLVAAVLLIFIFRGDKRGFISSLLGVIGWAASFIAAFLCYPAGVDFLDKYTNLRSDIDTRIVQYVKERAISQLSGTSDGSELPDSVKAVLASSSNSAVNAQAEKIAAPIVDVIMNVIAIILIMIIVGIILKIIISIIRNAVRNNRVIGSADRVLGILFGFVEGIFLSYLLLLCLYYVSVFLDVSMLSSQLDDSIVMGFLQQYNMIPYADSLNNLSALAG